MKRSYSPQLPLRVAVRLRCFARFERACDGGVQHGQAPAHTFTGARTSMLAVRGSPFGVASTGDGRWSFVDETTGAVAVFADASDPRGSADDRVPGEAVGNSLADGGRLLLVAGVGPDAQEASVLSVAARRPARATRNWGYFGARIRWGWRSIEVSGTPDGAYAFVSVEYGDRVDVFNLRAALRGGFKRSTYVGSISLGTQSSVRRCHRMGAGCT